MIPTSEQILCKHMTSAGSNGNYSACYLHYDYKGKMGVQVLMWLSQCFHHKWQCADLKNLTRACQCVSLVQSSSQVSVHEYWRMLNSPMKLYSAISLHDKSGWGGLRAVACTLYLLMMFQIALECLCNAFPICCCSLYPANGDQPSLKTQYHLLTHWWKWELG